MSIKYSYGGVIPDLRNQSGNWVRTVNKDNFRYYTVSSVRWSGIYNRCLKDGYIQNKQPTYIGVTNEFKDFQNFVEWSRNQVGYDSKGFEIDKDLLVKRNKIYSPETCLFIPRRINLLIVKCDSRRGEFPIGVRLRKNGKFEAVCKNNNGKNTYLGYHNTPEEAFQAYKVYKEALIKEVAEEYKDTIDIRAYNALMSYTVEIDD